MKYACGSEPRPIFGSKPRARASPGNAPHSGFFNPTDYQEVEMRRSLALALILLAAVPAALAADLVARQGGDSVRLMERPRNRAKMQPHSGAPYGRSLPVRSFFSRPSAAEASQP